jgi:DNA-binding CsgD family transcriptional regulator
LLTYHYFNYSWFSAAIAVIALATGVVLTHSYYKDQNMPGNACSSPVESLTAKELQIMELISLRKSNKEIAELNFVELSTVKTHINNIYCKLGAKNRKEAISTYYQCVFQQKSTLSPPAVI